MRTDFDPLIIKAQMNKALADFRSLNYTDRRAILVGLTKVHNEQSFPFKKPGAATTNSPDVVKFAKEFGVTAASRKFNCSREKIYRIIRNSN